MQSGDMGGNTDSTEVIVPVERLVIRPDQHAFETQSGQPFFWLGDTAWNLFHRLSRDEIMQYYANRQQKGFTVIQAVLLMEQDGLNTPNWYGETPLHDNDPLRPNEAYFARIDDYLRLAERYGLYVCVLPTWADKVTPGWGVGPAIFTEQNAEGYARWLAERYQGYPNVIWCLGGDRPPVKAPDNWLPIWRAMVSGLRAVLGSDALITYHPDGGQDSPRIIHAEPWSDFVMIQSGHWARETPGWEWIEALFNRTPVKPVIDGEPNYEDHPAAPWPTWYPRNGYFRDYEVRKQVYRTVFAGGAGVTYGHHAIWQFAGEQYPMINHADRTWQQALDRPAAFQMIHLRHLIESRPFRDRIPDQTLLASVGVGGGEHQRACRDVQGRYAMIYLPTYQTVGVRVGTPMLNGERLSAWWYNPRTGSADTIGTFDNAGELAFTTPIDGPDWVLVLDSVEARFGKPGSIVQTVQNE